MRPVPLPYCRAIAGALNGARPLHRGIYQLLTVKTRWTVALAKELNLYSNLSGQPAVEEGRSSLLQVKNVKDMAVLGAAWC